MPLARPKNQAQAPPRSSLLTKGGLAPPRRNGPTLFRAFKAAGPVQGQSIRSSMLDGAPGALPHVLPRASGALKLAHSSVSLRSLEDAERLKLAKMWLQVLDEVKAQSEVLLEVSTLPVQQQVHLFLDRAPTTLRRHLSGWRFWASHCRLSDIQPGQPDLAAFIAFVDAFV